MGKLLIKIGLFTGRYFSLVIGGIFIGLTIAKDNTIYLIVAFPLLILGGVILENINDRYLTNN